MAVEEGKADVVKVLVNAGADLEATDWVGLICSLPIVDCYLLIVSAWTRLL